MSGRGAEYDRRAAVLQALRAGRSPAEISEFLRVPRSTVYRIAKRVRAQEGGGDSEDEGEVTPERKKRKSGPGKKRTPAFLQQLQALIEEDPMKSLRQLARELDVSPFLIRQAVHEDLRFNSYVLRVRQLLTDGMKARRLMIGKQLLGSLKREASGLVRVFSDEKIFTVDRKTNRRNTRYLCRFPDEVPVAMKTKFPASVMVLGVVTSNGDVMPPHFFEQNEKVNTDVYLRVLETVVLPWIKEVTRGAGYVFQQDSAPAHAAKKTQEWCRQNMHLTWTKEFWPPNSPDLNPLDYFVWGEVERVSNKNPHPSREALKRTIEETMAAMDRAVVKRACGRFRSRLERMVAAEGGFIE